MIPAIKSITPIPDDVEIDPSIPVIHATDRKLYKECHKKYQYKVIDRLDPVDGSANYFLVGQFGHKALECWYTKQDFNLDEVQEEFQIEPSDLDMMQGVLGNYALKYRNDQREFEIVAIEKEFRVLFEYEDGTKVLLTCRIDMLIKYRGNLYIMDHKFLSTMINEEQLELDDQMTTYLWATYIHGLICAGALYNVVIKTELDIPKTNLNGSLSVNKMQNTTASIFIEVMKAKRLPMTDKYREYIDYLNSRPDPFLRRYWVARSPKELPFFQVELVEEMYEIARKHQSYYRNTSFFCNKCIYKHICKTEAEGGNGESIRKHLYKIRPEGMR